MPEWLVYVGVAAGSGLCSFVGAVAGTRVEIAWIKQTLRRHDIELAQIRSQLR